MYTTESAVQDELDLRIIHALVKLGVPFALDGFRYLCRMTRRVSDCPEEAELVTKILYPNAARFFHVRQNSVTGASARAIQRAYENNAAFMPSDYFDEYGAPLTISAFIELTARKIRNGEL